jgi:hypothetical protein
MAEDTVKDEVVKPTQFDFYSIDGTLMYTSNQEEFDDVFFSIIALGVWTKTFEVGTRLKLTFTTISESKKMDLLSKVKTWSDGLKATSQMFDQYLTKVNLCNYLSTIEIDKSIVNLREAKDDERFDTVSQQAEQALSLYGSWLYVFQEIIRRSLTAQVALKNS